MYFRHLCFLFIVVSSFCSAHQHKEINNYPLEQIIANRTTCVKEISDNKVYLREEKIYATPNGIFLILNEQGEYILIPELLSDLGGCFVQRSSPRNDDIIYNICPFCGRRYIISCKNPDCLSNQPKPKPK
jgi:hypothetical protein